MVESRRVLGGAISLAMFLMTLLFILGFLVAAVIAYFLYRGAIAKHRQLAGDAERRAALAEHLAELGTMTGGLAHEIKNPLSTIGLNAELLSEDIAGLADVPADEKRRLTNRIGTLYREIDRLRGILEDFLQFAGRMHLDPGVHDFNVLIEELVDFFQPQAERAGVRLQALLPKEALFGKVDSHLFKQAVLNLLINGVQALEMMPTEANGPPRELMLRLERERGSGSASAFSAGGDDSGAGNSIRAAEGLQGNGGGFIVLHVTDTGPGMSADAVKKIFQPYFSTKAGGTGLGLPTTRRIINAHGGRLEVHSELGRGTDFVIYLPGI